MRTPPVHDGNSSMTTTVSLSHGAFSQNNVSCEEVNQMMLGGVLPQVQQALPQPLIGMGDGRANLMVAYHEDAPVPALQI